MSHSPQGQDTLTVAGSEVVPTSRRSLVLVGGSGRSGTSLFAGILQRLGFYVPPPEVPSDDTNPRGFAESQWVVDFHTRLLKRAGVQVSDARPAAWAQMANVALDESVQQELQTWLREQFRESDHVIIKDPRLSWFLPLWRRCGEDVGASPRFATMLRHPTEVIESKQRWYGTWQGDAARAAGWLNQVLFTERATREAPRVFVRYEDLLDDWTKTVARVGKALDLALIRDAPASSMIRVHEFVDRGLSRSRASWDDLKMPSALREQADEVWELLSQLADEDGAEPRSLTERLEAARAAYIDLYEEAEAIAQSSVAAARRNARASGARVSTRAVRLAARVVPDRYKSRVPPHWRRMIVRVLEVGGGSRR